MSTSIGVLLRALSIAVLGLCIVARTAAAHAIGLSRGEYRRTDDGLDVEIVLAASELASLAKGDLERDVLRGIHVAAGSSECAGYLIDALRTADEGVVVRARYRCSPPDAILRVRLDLLRNLSHGHRHAARVVSGDVTSDQLCFERHPEFDVPAPAAREAAREAAPRRSAFGFLRMGLEHILSGYDHLVFLFGLVIVGARLRSLLGVVTAFTLGHSLTLALAVLGIVSPPARIVEPAIALSIVYVGVENLFGCHLDQRWRITFPFGLVHGFGFAGALAEVGLPRGDVPVALLTFNAGVELGQLGVLALLVPVLRRLQRMDVFQRRLVPAFSVCVMALGVAWLAQRVG
jgi:hydrogenase/urease accessory protein HupE